MKVEIRLLVKYILVSSAFCMYDLEHLFIF